MSVSGNLVNDPSLAPILAAPGAVSSLREYVGRQGVLKIDQLRVAVQCVDARQCWQRIDVLVTPIAGSGEQWVSADRLTFPDF